MADNFGLNALELRVQEARVLQEQNDYPGIDGVHTNGHGLAHLYYTRDGERKGKLPYKGSKSEAYVPHKPKAKGFRGPVSIPTSPRRLKKRSVPFRKHIDLFR